MTTKLDKTLKREINLDGTAYIIALSPEGIKITEKGKRKGQESSWSDLISGKVALTHALKDSIGRVRDSEEEN